MAFKKFQEERNLFNKQMTNQRHDFYLGIIPS